MFIKLFVILLLVLASPASSDLLRLCDEDIECENGYVCVFSDFNQQGSGHCVRRSRGCLNDRDCEKGYMCDVLPGLQSGICQKPHSGCLKHSDCKYGQQCIIGIIGRYGQCMGYGK